MNARLNQQSKQGWVTNKLSVFTVVLLAILTTALISVISQVINTTGAYALAAPTLTSATPNTSYNYGGDTVTITGADFQDGTKIKFGAVTTTVTFIDTNTITAIVPANGQIGPVSMEVINPDRQSAILLNAFTMKQIAPTISNVSPISGPAKGGNSITLNGSGFSKGMQFKQVSAGDRHSCGLTGDGKVYCWGMNGWGQLGNGSTTSSLTPVAVSSDGVLAGKFIESIEVGGLNSFAIDTDGKVYSWGANAYGQLGNGLTVSSNIPVAVDVSGAMQDKSIVKLSAGCGMHNGSTESYDHVLAIDSNGQLYAWGYNGNGQLGDGSTTNSYVPVAVKRTGTILDGKTIVDISAAKLFSTALDSDGKVYSWGYNGSGQFGDGTTTSSVVPVGANTTGVLSGKIIKSISSGTADDPGNSQPLFGFVVALDADGKIYSWGSNYIGQLGNNSTTNSSLPVAVYESGVLSGKTITKISAGKTHVLALDSNNQMYSWGSNSYGQLGNATYTNSSVPVVVSMAGNLAGKTIESISAGGFSRLNVYYYEHSLAIDSNGQAYSWGYNGNGQLGDNTTQYRAGAVAVLQQNTNIPFTFKVDNVTANILNTNATSISAQSPPHAGGVVNLSLESPSVDPVVLTNQYTYYEAPDLSSFSIAPNSSYNTAGDTVTITGNNFQEGTKIKFGAVTTTTTFVDSNTLTAIIPSNQQIGLISIEIINPDGQKASVQNAFTFKQIAPTVTSVVPDKGPTKGGNSIALNGSGFTRNIQFKQISAGTNHSCGLTGDSEIYCWGSNGSGQLGNNSTTGSSSAVAVDTSGVLAGKTITKVVASTIGNFTLALDSDGKVYAWGLNSYGQLGDNTVSSRTTPVAVNTSGVLASKIIKDISAGANHSVALDSDGKVYAWGYGGNGELGNNSLAQNNVPVSVYTAGVLAGKIIDNISVGANHTVVTDTNGKVYAWGYNVYGQLGNGTNTASNVPVAVISSGNLVGQTIIALAAGQSHTLALSSSGQIYAWGYGIYGQLGNNLSTTSYTPVVTTMSGVLAGKTITKIAAGSNHSAAIDSNGQAYSWGLNNYGQLGDNTNTTRPAPVVVTNSGVLAGKVLQDICDGSNYTIAIDSNGQAYGWGSNTSGELGDNAFTNRPIPVTTNSQVNMPFVVKIDGLNTSILNTTSSVISLLSPAHTPGLVDISLEAPNIDSATSANAYTYVPAPDVSNGFSLTPNAAYNTSGDTITITGANFQSGAKAKFGAATTDTTFIDSNTLTVIVPSNQQIGLVSFSVINPDGQSGEVQNAFTMKQVAPTISSVNPAFGPTKGGNVIALNGSGLTRSLQFKEISGGGFSLSCGLTGDSKIYCWGYNTDGELGAGDSFSSATSSIPVPVDMSGVLSGKTIIDIEVGRHHVLALDSNGQVYAWGYNLQGQLGNNTNTNSNIPVVVNNTGALAGKTIKAITAGQNYSLALDTNGQVYAWGYNGYGQLGDNSVTNRNTPAVVSATGVLAGKFITKIETGSDGLHTVALDSNGRIYTWGYNANGQLGDNTITQRNIPVAVNMDGVLAGKVISDISAGTNHTLALDSTGKVYSWGYNASGQLGNGSTTASSVPVIVNTTGVLSDKIISNIAASSNSSSVLDTSGKMYSWGYNGLGQLGDNTTANKSVPVSVNVTGLLAGKVISGISVGNDSTLAIDTNGQAYAWGYNGYGQLGDNTTINRNVPVATYSQSTITFSAKIDGINSVILSYNSNSISALAPSHTPALVGASIEYPNVDTANLTDAYEYLLPPDISADFSITPNTTYNTGGDTVTITGANFKPGAKVKLGAITATTTFINSNTLTISIPANQQIGLVSLEVINPDGQSDEVQNALTFKQQSPTITNINPTSGPAAGYNSIALTGVGFTRNLQFKDVSAGVNHTCGLTGEGDIYCWGLNNNGQLGNGTTLQSSAPVLVNKQGVLTGKSIIAIAVGGNYSLALDSDGKIYSWGNNNYGQLGNNSTVQSLTPVEVSSSGVLSGKIITKIDAGGDETYGSSMALDSEGKVYTWGYNTHGQLGNSSTTQSLVPVNVSATGALSGKIIKDISISTFTTMALDTDGAMYIWGSNLTSPTLITPKGVMVGKTITAIEVSSYLSTVNYTGYTSPGSYWIALDANGQVYTSGDNTFGQLGNNSTVYSANPVAINNYGALIGKTITQIIAAPNFAMAMDSNHQIYSWGTNSNGQLGNNSTTQSLIPISITSSGALAGKTVSKLFASGYSTTSYTGSKSSLGSSFALDADGQVYSWGYNIYGKLGDNTLTQRNTAVKIYDQINMPITAKIDGSVVDILNIASTRLDILTLPHSPAVVDISLEATLTDTINLPSSYTFVGAPDASTGFSITPSSAYNTGGDVVTITGTNFKPGARVKFGAITTDATFIDTNTLTVVIPANQQIGLVDVTIINPDGQSGEAVNAFTMKQVAPMVSNVNPNAGPVIGGNTVTITGAGFTNNLQFSQIATGGNFSCGLTGNGRVYCWGINTYGQLGNSSTANSTTPVAVDVSGVLSGKKIQSIAVGGYHVVVLDTNGQIYTWGYNNSGQLGDGTTTSKSSPIAVNNTGVLSGKIITKISAGGNYGAVNSNTAAIDSDGKVYTWGNNEFGQLGIGSTVASALPVAVNTAGILNSKKITQVSLSGIHTMAIDSSGKVYGWGHNGSGSLGNNTLSSSSLPIATDTTGQLAGKTIKQISTSSSYYYWYQKSSYYSSSYQLYTYDYGYTVAIDTNGRAYAWGYNGFGQLGNNSTTNSSTPVDVYNSGVLSGKVLTNISTSGGHVIATDKNNQLYTWGNNRKGQLGNGNNTNSIVPIVVNSSGVLNGKKISHIAAGGDTRYYYWQSASGGGNYNTFEYFDYLNQSFVIDENGQFYSWGYNSDGQLGNNTKTDSSLATTGYTQTTLPLSVKIGGNSPAVINQTSTNLSFIAPTHAPGLVDISLEAPHIDTINSPNSYEYLLPPVISSVLPNTGSISGGDMIVISGSNFSSDSKVYFENIEATVNEITNSAITVTTPSSLTSGAVNVKVLDKAGQHDTSIKGYTYKVSTPVILNLTPNKGPVAGGQSVTLNGSGLTNEIKFKQVSQGSNHSCGLTESGKIYCWGANTYGQLGNGLTTQSNIPVEVDTTGVLAGKTIVKVSVGGYFSTYAYGFTIALDSNGKMYAWGQNYYGNLGNNSTVTSSIPVAVNDSGLLHGKVITDISAGSVHSAAIDSNGQAYTWGFNGQGELGDNSLTDRSIPVAVDTTGVLSGKIITKIKATTRYTIALDSNGHVYTWGYNPTGQLGDNSTTQRQAPVAVSTSGVLAGKTIKDISGESYLSYGHTVVVDDSGKVYAWGYNANGQLGNNSTAQSLVPVAVDTTGVLAGNIITSVSAGVYSDGTAHNLALDDKGRVYSWGYNNYGQLGNGLTATSLVPVSVPLNNLSAKSISAGGSSSSILTSNGQIYSWGLNNTGQLGNNTTSNSLIPASLNRTNLSKQSIITNLSLGGNLVSVKSITDTALTFNTPAHSAGQVDLVSTIDNGEVLTNASAYEYKTGPVIDSVSPNNGYITGGEIVYLNGSNFSNQTTVKIGETTVTPIFINENMIQITSPSVSYAQSVDITVTDEYGQNNTLSNGYKYNFPPPKLNSINPTRGPVSGGNSVTLNGSDFQVSSGSVQVLVVAGGGGAGGSAGDGWNGGGGGAGGLVCNPSFSIDQQSYNVTVGDGGTRGVSSSTNNGSSTTRGLNGGNSIFGSINAIGGGGGGAASGITGGVNLKNNGLAGGSGGGAGASYSGSYIIGGLATNGQGFNGGNSSNSGSGFGGGGGGAGAIGNGPVTNSGSGLGKSYSITGSAITYASGGSTGVPNPTNATTNTGNGGNGSYEPPSTLVNSGNGGSGVVIVSYPTGTITATGGTITSLNGNTIHTFKNNDTFNITSSPAVVKFDSQLATITNSTGGSIMINAPPHAAGIVDVSIVNSDGQSAILSGAYEYVAPPTIISISPSQGLTAGGNNVFIYGTNFSNLTTISFGGVLSSVSFIDENTILATVPASALPGNVDVEVVDEFNQTGKLVNGYTYRLATPTLVTAAPNKSVMKGGGIITLTGTNFVSKAGGSWYKLLIDGVEATNLTVVNSTTLTATIPAHNPGVVDIDLISDYTDSAAIANGFTYLPDIYTFATLPCTDNILNSDGIDCSLMATQPGHFKIEAKDENGNLVTSTNNISLSLSTTSGSGSFGRVGGLNPDGSPQITWGIANVVIPAGVSDIEVYYRDSMSGNPTITVKDILNTSVSKDITVLSRYKLLVTGVTDPTNAGVPSSVTVQAVDYTGVPQSDYRGTIHFTSTDGLAILPGDYTFTSTDRGRKTFTNGVTFKTPGIWDVIATDNSDSTITGKQVGVVVGVPSDGTISKLKFITPVQSFPLDKTSGVITVQTQDNIGLVIPADEDTTIYIKTSSSTGQFSLDDGATWLTPNANGQIPLVVKAGTSSVSFRYQDTTKNTHILKISNSETGDFGWSPDTQNVIVGVGAPAKLAISGPDKVGTGEWYPITVSLTDASDNPVTAIQDITFKLSSRDGAKLSFSADGSDSADDLSSVLNAGQTSITVYSMSQNVGSFRYIAIDSRPQLEGENNMVSGNFMTNIFAKPSRLVISTPKTDVMVHSVMPINISLQDQFGNIALSDNDFNFNLDSSSDITEFSTSGTGNWLSTLDLTILAGTGSLAAYVTQPTVQSNVTISVLSDTYGKVDHVLNFVPNVYTHIGFVNPKTNLTAGDETTYTVQLLDDWNNPTTHGTDVVIGLGSNNQALLDEQPRALWDTTAASIQDAPVKVNKTITIPAGQNSASAVYADNLATDKTVISAQDNAKWQSYCTSWRTSYYGDRVCENWYHYNDSFIRHNLNVSPDTPKLYTFTTDPQVIIKNTVSKPISISITDQFTNPSYFNNLTSLDLNSVSSTGKFYSDQLGDNEVTKLDFAANASNATFYYRDSTVSPIAGYDLSLNSSLTGTPQPIRIIEGFATNLEIDTAGATTVKAGDYLPLTIKALTSDNREVVVLGDKIISLASSEGNFYKKVGADYTPISQVTIPAESSRTTLGDLYYRSQSIGSKTLVASGAELAQTKAYIEVTPDNFTKLAFTAHPTTIEITKTSSVFNVTSQDLYGNVTVANATADTLINLESTQASGLFSVDGSDWSANSTLISLGQSVASFYYKNGTMNANADSLVDASVLGDQNITASSGAAGDTVTTKIVGQIATKLTVNPTSMSLVAGKMSNKIELQLQNSDGSAAITTTDQLINLRSLNLANDYGFTATYGADEFSSDGINKVSSLTLPAGSSKISFYLTSKTAVTHRIQAYADIHNYSGHFVRTVSAIQTVTVAPDVPSRLFIRSAPQTIHPILNNTADEYSAPIRVAMTDQFGNSTSQGTDRDVNLASSCAQGLFMNSPTGSVIASVKLLAGQSEVSVYYRDGVAHADACNLTMTSSGLDPDNQDIIVREKVIGLIITTPARSVIAGDVSDPINVSSKDRYGNIVTAETDTPLVFKAASTKAEVSNNGNVSGAGQSGGVTSLGTVSTQALTSTTTNVIPIGGDTASFTYTYTDSVDGIQIDGLTATDQAKTLGDATQNITILAGPAVNLKWQTTTINGQVDGYIPTQVGVLNEFNIPTTVDADTTVNLTNAAGLNPVTGDAAGDFYTRNPDNSYTKITSTVITAGDSVSPNIYYRQTTTTNTHAYDGYSPYTPILSYSTYAHPTSVTATADNLTTATLSAVNISALTLSFSTGNFSAVGRAFTPIKVNVNKALPTETTINLSMVAGSGAFYDSNNIPDDSDLINHRVTSVVIPAGQTSSNQVYFRQDARTATYPWRQPSVLSAEPVSPVYSTWGVRNSATIYYGEVTQIEFVSGPDTLEQNQTGSYIFQTKDSMGNITPFIPYVYGQPNQDTFCVYVKTTSLGGNFSTSRASTEICPSEPGVTGLYLYAGETNIPFNYKDVVVGNPTMNVSTYSSGSGGIEASKQLNITPGITTKVVIEPASYGLVRGDTIDNMNVKLMSNYGFNVNSLGNTTVNLVTNSPTGKFKNPSTGEWQASISVVIPTGSKSVNVSYRNDEGAIGSTDDITASSNGLTSGAAAVNLVTGDVASVGFATPPQTLERLQNGTVTLKLQDSFGNETVATTDTCAYLTTVSLTAKLTQTNPVGASACASLELPDGSLVHGLTVLAGTSKVSFNYQDSINGVYQLKTSLSPSLKIAPSTQNLTIIDGQPFNLRFDPITSSIERGGMASVAISLTNAYGAEVEATTDQYAKLTSTSASGEFALTELNTWQNELVVKINAGTSRTELIYRDTIAEIGDYQLTATYTDSLGDPITVDPLNPSVADIHIVNGQIKSLVFITPSFETTASHPSQKITVELQNQYGYSVTALTDQTVYFASSSQSGEFALSQDGPWGIANAKILAGQSSLDLYYRDTNEGVHQITARTSADNIELADTQDQTIVRQVMDHFVVDNISTPQKAGTPSSVVVFAVDSEGFVVQWYKGTITFSADTTDAIYPTDSYTFDPATDKGIHTFTNSIAFKLPGFKDITVTDKDNLTGTQYDIEVLGGNTNPVKSIAIISPTDDPLLLNPNEISSRITLQLRDANNTPTNATAVEGYPLHLTSSSPTTQFAFSPNGPWSNTLDITIEQGLSYSKQPIYCRDSTNGSYVITASDWVGSHDDEAVTNDTLNIVTKDLKIEDKLTIKSRDYTNNLIDNPYLFSNNSNGTISGQVELEASAKNRQSNNPTAANWQIKLNDRQNILIDSANFTDRTDIKYTSKELTPSHLDSSYLLDIRADGNGINGIDVKTVPISPWLASLDNINYDATKQTLNFQLNTTTSSQPADIDKATFYLPGQNISFSLSALISDSLADNTATGTYQISLPIDKATDGDYQLVVSLMENQTDAILAQDLKTFTVTTPVVAQPTPVVKTPITETPSTTTTDVVTPTKTKPQPTANPNNDNQAIAPTVLGELWNAAITSPVTPILASGSFFTILAIIAIILAYQAYREWRRSKWLLAMIKKDKALVEDKDAFLQLAAHYLRTPIAIVGSSVDLMAHVFHYDINLTNKLIAIATNLREKSEQILAQTNESPNVDKITAEDENAFKRRILRSPIFWLPITLSVVLTLLVNWVVTSLGGQNLDAPFIIGQMLSIILAGIVLYTAVREFTMYHEKEVKLEEYRVKARALDNIKNQFIADVYHDLSYDVAELATHDMQAIENEIVRNSLVDAASRLNKLIERFATLMNVQKGDLELSQFSLDSLINQAITELALDMPNRPDVTIPTSLHQDKRMLLKVIETILTTMSGKGDAKDFKFKASTTHSGSLKLEISGKTNFKLLSTSGNLFSADLVATDIEHYNYDEPATSDHINADYTVDADNANANNKNENNDDANTANNLDIYLSKLIVSRLGGKLSIKQTGERAVVGLTVPVNE